MGCFGRWCCCFSSHKSPPLMKSQQRGGEKQKQSEKERKRKAWMDREAELDRKEMEKKERQTEDLVGGGTRTNRPFQFMFDVDCRAIPSEASLIEIGVAAASDVTKVRMLAKFSVPSVSYNARLEWRTSHIYLKENEIAFNKTWCLLVFFVDEDKTIWAQEKCFGCPCLPERRTLKIAMDYVADESGESEGGRFCRLVRLGEESDGIL